jgi:hypothetical protein
MQFVLKIHEGGIGSRGKLDISEDGACKVGPDFPCLRSCPAQSWSKSNETNLRGDCGCYQTRFSRWRVSEVVFRWGILLEEGAQSARDSFDAKKVISEVAYAQVLHVMVDCDWCDLFAGTSILNC